MVSKELIRSNLITVNEESTVSQIQNLFKYQRNLVVLNGQKYSGIISESLAYRLNSDLSAIKVKNIMQKAPRITGDEPPEQVAKLMVESGFKLIPVTDQAGAFVGGVLADDLIKSFLNELKKVNVKTVMTPNPVKISVESTVGQGLALMRKQGVARLLVTDGSKIAGIVSLHDIVEKVIKSGFKQRRDKRLGEYKYMADQSIKSIMSADVKALNHDANAARAFELMMENSFSSVPVIENGQLAGIVTKEDILKQIASRTERGPTVFVQISTKNDMRSIDFDKEIISEKVKGLVRKYAKFLDNSTITFYIRNSELTSRGRIHFEVRLQVVGPNYKNSIIGEGWGLRSAVINAVSNLERLLQKEKETMPRTGEEFVRLLNQIL
ncbi:MAG: CBS domain-containing protein [Nitrososphaerota archaeon]|nr:CBS domain-containing protein [Nitrososphaerota archaeon]MDG6929801.1 CBS domain-containing protein [Nitrososphaerota archaeon]